MTDLHNPIPSLIARRVQIGADSPEGRRLSLLVEQLENPEARSLIPNTIREIEQIRANGGRYVHANHGAGR